MSTPATGPVKPATGLQYYGRLPAHRNVCIMLRPATGLQECMHTIRWCKVFTRMRVFSIRCFSFASLIVCIDLTSLSRPETGLVNFFSGAVVHQACLHQFVVRFAFVFRQSLATLGSKWKPQPVDRGIRQSGPHIKGNARCADAVFSICSSSGLACNTR